MARIRTIKPGFFRSDDVTPLSYRARLTWVGLWTYVDDDGRGKDNARIIKGEIWTLEDDVTHVEVEEDLEELHRHDRISRYEVDGKRYLVINKWLDHQVISRPTPSKLPEPAEHNMLTHAELTEPSVSDPDVDTAGRGRGKGSGRGREEELEGPQSWAIEPVVEIPAQPDWFELAWSHWPKKDDKKDARAKWPHAVREFGRGESLLSEIAQFHGDAYRTYRSRQMTPALAVWLNKARWDNDPVTADQSQQPPKPTPTERARATLALATDIDQLELNA